MQNKFERRFGVLNLPIWWVLMLLSGSLCIGSLVLSGNGGDLFSRKLNLFSELFDGFGFGFDLKLFLVEDLSIENVFDVDVLDLVRFGVLEHFGDFALFSQVFLDIILENFQSSFSFLLEFKLFLLFAFSPFNHFLEDFFLESEFEVLQIVFYERYVCWISYRKLNALIMVLLNSAHSGLFNVLNLSF